MTTKKTRMERPQPEVDEEAPVVIVQPRDPNRCYCVGVQRRYDGDGLIERGDPNTYRCAVCGKAYS